MHEFEHSSALITWTSGRKSYQLAYLRIMEEAYYNPYNPVHTSDFPPQDHLATTDSENPTQDRERPTLSASAAERARLNAQQGFNLGGSIVSEKHKNHSTGTKTTVWVFAWSDVVNYVLQTVALIAAVVFGVWAIRTYDAVRDSLAIAAAANELSSKVLAQNVVANSLALLTFCASIQAGPSSNFVSIFCSPQVTVLQRSFEPDQPLLFDYPLFMVSCRSWVGP